MMWSLKACCASLVCLLALPAAAQVHSFQLAQSSQAPATVQIRGSQVEYSTLKGVAHGGHVRIEKFVIPDGYVDLELGRVSVLTPDAELVVGSKDGFETIARPDVILLSGIVASLPDSRAYLAISSYGINGFVQTDGDLIVISTGAHAQGKDLRSSLKAALLGDLVDPNVLFQCGNDDGDPALFGGPAIDHDPGARGARGSTGTPSCREVRVAIDTDWEYTSHRFSGNTDAATAYAISLMGAVSDIYERDLNVRLAVPFIRVWADNSDPYFSFDAYGMLVEVQDEWNANMTHIDRSLTHLLSSKLSSGVIGYANLGVLCAQDGYGVSAAIVGFFTSSNRDIQLVSHEIGHNFNAGHTFNYVPPINDCTIMSYCASETEPLRFHPQIIDQIFSYLDTLPCGIVEFENGAGWGGGEPIRALTESTIDIDALGDQSNSLPCTPYTFVGTDVVSANGGSIEILTGQGLFGRDLFRYTSPTGFRGIDTFEYFIDAGFGTQPITIAVDVLSTYSVLRTNPNAGLKMEYYQIPAIVQFPDFSSLVPYGVGVSLDVSYPEAEGEVMGSGLEIIVGVVFTGYIRIPADDFYTFTLNSDDGSKLFIGEILVVDSVDVDAAFFTSGGEMATMDGRFPMAQGWHPIRIEYVQLINGAGLFATMESSAMGEVALSGAVISHESGRPCRADLNGDGSLNFFDVRDFIQAYAGQGSIADFTDDGELNFFDISSFLISFQRGCP